MTLIYPISSNSAHPAPVAYVPQRDQARALEEAGKINHLRTRHAVDPGSPLRRLLQHNRRKPDIKGLSD